MPAHNNRVFVSCGEQAMKTLLNETWKPMYSFVLHEFCDENVYFLNVVMFSIELILTMSLNCIFRHFHNAILDLISVAKITYEGIETKL